jgi:putative heme iron utilization protein
MTLTVEARQFLRGTQSGMLSTHSVRHPGYPYGSVAPFALDHSGQPLLLISTLAEHTRNILDDHRVSLLVFAGEEDLQANARLTLVADAELVGKDDELLAARYLRYIPQAAQYFPMHDFSLYRLRINSVRYIAGFGRMAWIDGDEFKCPMTALVSQEMAIIDHMNREHQKSMRDYCNHYHNIIPTEVEMVGIDGDGFDLRADGSLLRFHFKQFIKDPGSARTALIEMAMGQP